MHKQWGTRAGMLAGILVLALAGGAGRAASGPPISTDGSDPAKWDRKLDSVVVAANLEKIVYEDANIRVLSVTLPAGAEEPYHVHFDPAVVITDQLAKTVNRAAGGKVIAPQDEVDIAQTNFPRVRIQPPVALHSVKNVDTKPMHAIRVEFKKGQIAMLIPRGWPAGKMPISTDGSDPKTWKPDQDGPIAAPGNHKIVYEDANIRVQSVTIPAHTAEPYHDHPLPSVLVVDNPNMGIDQDIHGKGPELRSDGPPVVLITPPNAQHSIKNTGNTDGHLVRIEFKKGFGAPP